MSVGVSAADDVTDREFDALRRRKAGLVIGSPRFSTLAGYKVAVK